MSAPSLEFRRTRARGSGSLFPKESADSQAAGVRRRVFLGTAAGLGLSLIGALYSAALEREGRAGLASFFALLALALAGVSGCWIIRALLRRSLARMQEGYSWTRGGALYVAIAGVIAAAAFNTGNNLLYLILAILLAGFAVSVLLTKWVLDRLEIAIDVPDHVFARQETPAYLTLRNRKRWVPSYSITLSSPLAGNRAANSTPCEPGATVDNIFDRPVHIPYVPPRGVLTERIDLRLPTRGRYIQKGLVAESKFPFGVLRRRRLVPCHHEILVLPAVSHIPPKHPWVSEAGGELESALKGNGDEPCSLRPYVPGDSVRRVDWKASAKTQRLTVRELTQPQGNRIRLIFDTGVTDCSAETFARFEKSVEACASLVWRLYRESMWLEFMSPEFKLPMSPAATVVFRVLEALALIRPLALSGAENVSQMPARTGACRGEIVFSSASSLPLDPAGARSENP